MNSLTQTPTIFPFDQFPLAWRNTHWCANLKSTVEDFKVHEVLGFQLSSEQVNDGDFSKEHLYLFIQKKQLNTLQVAQYLAEYFSVDIVEIKYAGLKDKQAVTQQWFSVRLPGKQKQLDINLLNNFNLYLYIKPKNLYAQKQNIPLCTCIILKALWHGASLQRGAIKENRFDILLRAEQAPTEQVLVNLEHIKNNGFPNYFGRQRFGINGSNLLLAEKWFSDAIPPARALQSLVISSARSFLFNQILAHRVLAHNWDKLIVGDRCMLQGTRQFFLPEHIDKSLSLRCQQADIHPAAVLYGKDRVKIGQLLENKVLQNFPMLCRGLEKSGIKSAQRALRALPQNFAWEIENKTNLRLRFSLPSGSYATRLVAELGEIKLSS